MHILVISSGDFFSTYGGGQVYVKNLVDEMIRQGREVTLLSYVDEKKDVVRKDYHGIDLYEVGQDASEADISSTIQEIAPDVIHANGHKAQACRIGRKLNIPVVVTAHHGGILCPAGALLTAKDEICNTSVCARNCLKCVLRNTRGGTFFYPLLRLMPERWLLNFGRWLTKKPFIYFVTPIGSAVLHIDNKRREWQEIAKGCSRMIAPCYAIAEAMIRNGIKEKKIEIIPHGIPLPTTKTLSNDSFGYKKFYYVGRVCQAKGTHVMLKAFHSLPNRNIELHIIGDDDRKGQSRNMKYLLKKYKADTRIIWHGKVPHQELDKIIANYDVLIHPTICLEIFGLNIAEALTRGKPVLATRCGGAEMQIEDGKNGWLIAPNDVQALEEKLRTILEEKEILSFTPHVISITDHASEVINAYAQQIKES